MRATCPNCGREYDTVLNPIHADIMAIQDEFPNAPAWQREQCITGICSDMCWVEYMGIDEEAVDRTEYPDAGFSPEYDVT